jgi:hypothetical protein
MAEARRLTPETHFTPNWSPFSLMSFIGRFVRAAFAGMVITAAPLAFAPAQAQAQEISPSHLAIAIEVVKSAKASRGFDNVLPILAEQVENRLIRVRPDLHNQITDAVEAVALKLASRRADLDADVARIWAKAFTEDELKTIATFYQSAAGQKFADVGPKVVADSFKAVDQWSSRVGDELLAKSRDELKSKGIDF